MAAGSDPKPAASLLLARWLATAPQPGVAAFRRPAAAAPERASPPPDPALLFRQLAEAIGAEALPPEGARALSVVLEPLRCAAEAPGELDPAALLTAFEQAEDVLEAFLLGFGAQGAVRRPGAPNVNPGAR